MQKYQLYEIHAKSINICTLIINKYTSYNNTMYTIHTINTYNQYNTIYYYIHHIFTHLPLKFLHTRIPFPNSPFRLLKLPLKCHHQPLHRLFLFPIIHFPLPIGHFHLTTWPLTIPNGHVVQIVFARVRICFSIKAALGAFEFEFEFGDAREKAICFV